MPAHPPLWHRRHPLPPPRRTGIGCRLALPACRTRRAKRLGAQRLLTRTANRASTPGSVIRSGGPKRASAGKSKSVEPKPEPLARALLDHVYRATAELCGLDEFGRDEIITKRQFPNGVDTGVPYFSLPRSGGHVEQVSRQLVAQFGTDVLARVPGFRVHCALPRHRDLQH